MLVALKKGAKLTDNPKDFMLRVRIDKETLAMLDECCKELDKSRSEAVRVGIKELHSNIKK